MPTKRKNGGKAPVEMITRELERHVSTLPQRVWRRIAGLVDADGYPFMWVDAGDLVEVLRRLRRARRGVLSAETYFASGSPGLTIAFHTADTKYADAINEKIFLGYGTMEQKTGRAGMELKLHGPPCAVVMRPQKEPVRHCASARRRLRSCTLDRKLVETGALYRYPQLRLISEAYNPIFNFEGSGLNVPKQVLIVNEGTGQERSFSSMRAAARFINVDLLKFRSSAAWFRIGDCPTDALGRRSRIVVLDGVVEGGQQVFPAGPARITIMGDRTETAAEARRQNYINCCNTRLQVSGLKSRLGLFPDENGIPIYRTFDFEQDLPANSLAVATDLSYLDGLLADGSMWMDRGGNLYISWVQAREQPLRTIAEANAHRGAAFYGPYANGFRQDGSQCVIYRMSITGKKAEQLLEDVLRESAGFEWMLQKKRLIKLLLRFSREKAGLTAQGRRRLISHIRRSSRQLRPAAWNDWAQLEEDGDLELVEDAEDVVEGSDDEDVLLAPSDDEEGSGSDEEGDEDESMAGSSASDTGSEEEDESEGGSSTSDDGSGYEDEAEDEDEGDAME